MIKLYYKEFELGYLTFDYENNVFVYNSNVENENKAKAKYLGMEFYYLSNSKNKRQKILFENFIEYTECLGRTDIIEKAKIQKDDTLYEKLEKIAKLNWNNEGFYIKYGK